MVKQPGHLTSMKKERGAGTRVWMAIVSIEMNPRLQVVVAVVP